MSDWKIAKGPVPIDELQAYIQDLSDIRNKEDFPKLRLREETLIVTDILNKFEGKYRMVTTDLKGRKKLFDISDPFYCDGTVLYFPDEFVELGWKDYYSYWTKLDSYRPDPIEWCDDTYTVYSLTKVVGEDCIYVVVGSESNERITLRFDDFTTIIRDAKALGQKHRWTVLQAKMVIDARKWD